MNKVIELLIYKDINDKNTTDAKIEYLNNLISELENIVNDIKECPWDFE